MKSVSVNRKKSFVSSILSTMLFITFSSGLQIKASAEESGIVDYFHELSYEIQPELVNYGKALLYLEHFHLNCSGNTTEIAYLKARIVELRNSPWLRDYGAKEVNNFINFEKDFFRGCQFMRIPADNTAQLFRFTQTQAYNAENNARSALCSKFPSGELTHTRDGVTKPLITC